MVSNFLNEQRRRLIALVQEKPMPQPEAITALVLMDILDLLQQVKNEYLPTPK